MTLEIVLGVVSIGSTAILSFVCLQLMKHTRETIHDMAKAIKARDVIELDRPKDAPTELPVEPLFTDLSMVDDDTFFKHIAKANKKIDNEEEENI